MSAVPISRYLVEFRKPGSSKTPALELPGDFAANAEEDAFPALSAFPETEEPLVDPNQEIEAAHARGAAEARAAAELEFVQKLAELRIAADERNQQERQRWVAEEGERLGEQIRAALADLEAAIAGSVARILKPFLAETLRRQIVEELQATLARILAEEGPHTVRVGGPRDLLEALAQRMGEAGKTVDFVPDSAADVRIVADETIIESRLSEWLARFDSAVE